MWDPDALFFLSALSVPTRISYMSPIAIIEAEMIGVEVVWQSIEEESTNTISLIWFHCNGVDAVTHTSAHVGSE